MPNSSSNSNDLPVSLKWGLLAIGAAWLAVIIHALTMKYAAGPRGMCGDHYQIGSNLIKK